MTKDSILVVEDSDTMRHLLRLVLEENGYQVLDAAEGEEALAQVRDHDISMVITDIRMPGMDGVEFVRHFRSIPRHRETPVLVLSGEQDDYFRYFGRELDAQEWMDKPFSVSELLESIAQHLNTRRKRTGAGTVFGNAPCRGETGERRLVGAGSWLALPEKDSVS